MKSQHPSYLNLAENFTSRPPRRIFYETLLIFGLTIFPSLLIPDTKNLLAFLPILYILIEKWLRKRSWAGLGFQRANFWQALKANAWLVLLVSVVVQLMVAFIARAFWPALLDHILSRVPLGNIQLLPLLGLLAVAALGEELVYRSLFQERLSWFVTPPLAIVGVALVFGLMHWAAGDLAIVATDVFLVVLDGVIYGVIFWRGKNIYVAWLAHFLANVVAFSTLLLFYR